MLEFMLILWQLLLLQLIDNLATEMACSLVAKLFLKLAGLRLWTSKRSSAS